LSFKFDYRVLSERLRIKQICPRDADLQNGSQWRERENTPAKNNKAKPKQLKLTETNLSKWPQKLTPSMQGYRDKLYTMSNPR
jgi:hypothetical protein